MTSNPDMGGGGEGQVTQIRGGGVASNPDMGGGGGGASNPDMGRRGK